MRLFFLLTATLLNLSLPAQAFENLAFTEASAWQVKRLPSADYLAPNPAGKGRCARLSGPFSAYESGYIHQDIPLKITNAGRYTVSGKIRTRGARGEGANLYTYGKIAGAVTGFTQSTPLNGDTEWTQVSYNMILTPEMDTLRLGCFLGGEGTAWFDSLRFEPFVPENKEVSPTAENYITEFFDTVRPAALGREAIDWPALERDVRHLAVGAQVAADVYPAMQYALRRINRHSFMMEPAVAAQMNGGGLADKEVDPKLVYTSGRRINDEIAYLSMPQVGTGHQPTINAFADSLQGLIAALDTEATTGWVLDLRGNGGGNCWPMLAGIGPLLGEGVCGHFQEPDGSNASPWAYLAGQSLERGNPRATTRNYRLRNPAARIAVLTGPQTASSGEVVTTAFVGHPRARSFGQPTAGYSTTNASITLSDGALLLLTVSVYADRNKRPVPLHIPPDVTVEPEEGKDAALAAAVEWLQN